MAHYAFLDENNIVTEVIVGRNEWEEVDGITDWEKWYGDFRGQKCVRTSYNHKIRKQFAAIGDFYDEERDVFLSPPPYESWVLDENNDWVAPIPMPELEENQIASWVEPTQEWLILSKP